MGKPKPSPPEPYRDDPEADAVSLHTTRSDYEYDVAPDLPSYSDSEAATASTNQVPNGAPVRTFYSVEDPYPRLQPPSGWRNTTNGKVQNVNKTSNRMDSRLSDAGALNDYIKNYLTMIPPRQLVRIVGTHSETKYNSQSKKNEKETVTDFDITFSLQSFFSLQPEWRELVPADNSDKTYRGSFRKTRAQGYSQDIEIANADAPSLQDHCRDFCNDKSALKIFRVTRQVAGLHENVLQQYIEQYVRSTHYHGHLDVSLPIDEENVDIYSDHWINRWRNNWVRYIFYFTFLWIITWPVLFFASKWWSVFEVRWYFSRYRPAREGQAEEWTYVRMSEMDWLNKHKNLIISLVQEKYQGDASGFPTDVPDERIARSSRARVPSTGNPNVDGAVNFIQGGMDVWNAVQGRGTREPNGWGGDS